MDTYKKSVLREENAIACPPDEFSWVIEGKLCGMALPTREENIQFLESIGVNHVVSLTTTLPNIFCRATNIVVFRCEIEDHTPPSQRQIEDCLEFIENTNKRGEAVAVHCAYGIGRTGTILACYFVKHCRMKPSEAISHIRALRHHESVETLEQEHAVFSFYESCFES